VFRLAFWPLRTWLRATVAKRVARAKAVALKQLWEAVVMVRHCML
jgi:hypothetical protein